MQKLLYISCNAPCYNHVSLLKDLDIYIQWVAKDIQCLAHWMETYHLTHQIWWPESLMSSLTGLIGFSLSVGSCWSSLIRFFTTQLWGWNEGPTTIPLVVGSSFRIPHAVTLSSGSNLMVATSPGVAAHQTEKNKLLWYQLLSDKFMVEPMAVEISQVHNSQIISLFMTIGAKIAVRKCELCESEWLFQCISLAILWSNNFSILSAVDIRNISILWEARFSINPSHTLQA